MASFDLQAIVSSALLIGVRVGGLMLFAPFFAGQSLPPALKVALTVAVTALLYPLYRPAVTEIDVLGWVGVVAGELIVGLGLGLALQFVFEAAQMAGHLVGVQAGYSLVTLLDPQTQADTPVMGTFNQLIATLIFLELNLHHWLLRGLADTFVYLPAGTVLASLNAGRGLLLAAGGIWLVGVQMAAPVVIATLLVDVTLGFLAKAAPQMPVLFVGLSIKTVLSLLIVGITLAWWPALLERHFGAGLALGERWLRASR